MESQPQNPEFMNNPENFHPCVLFCLVEYPSSFITIKNVNTTSLSHIYRLSTAYMYIKLCFHMKIVN